MADRPILMSAPMVRATMREVEVPDTGKTNTRRIPRGEVLQEEALPSEAQENLDLRGWGRYPQADGSAVWVKVPWAVGDRAWVRETWAQHTRAEDRVYAKGDGHPWGSPIYRATFGAILAPACEGFTPWRSPIHMPRWASRLTLMIEDVRVQRLQDISEEDARAEGSQEPTLRNLGGDLAQAAMSERQVFSRLWDHIHGPGAWGQNPWIYALTFRPVLANIDSLGAPDA